MPSSFAKKKPTQTDVDICLHWEAAHLLGNCLENVAWASVHTSMCNIACVHTFMCNIACVHTSKCSNRNSSLEIPRLSSLAWARQCCTWKYGHRQCCTWRYGHRQCGRIVCCHPINMVSNPANLECRTWHLWRWVKRDELKQLVERAEP